MLKLDAGDLLLMQGPTEVMADFINGTGGVPLRERELRIPEKRMAIIAGAIMPGSVGVVTAGLLAAAAAFTPGMIASMRFRTVPPRQVYTAIGGLVIVLLAALIPVAGAMQSTGTADVLSRFLVDTIAQGNAIAVPAVVLITTMLLSDLMNNATTAAVLGPGGFGFGDYRKPGLPQEVLVVGVSIPLLLILGHCEAASGPLAYVRPGTHPL